MGITDEKSTSMKFSCISFFLSFTLKFSIVCILLITIQCQHHTYVKVLLEHLSVQTQKVYFLEWKLLIRISYLSTATSYIYIVFYISLFIQLTFKYIKLLRMVFKANRLFVCKCCYAYILPDGCITFSDLLFRIQINWISLYIWKLNYV